MRRPGRYDARRGLIFIEVVDLWLLFLSLPLLFLSFGLVGPPLFILSLYAFKVVAFSLESFRFTFYIPCFNALLVLVVPCYGEAVDGLVNIFIEVGHEGFPDHAVSVGSEVWSDFESGSIMVGKRKKERKKMKENE